MEGKLQELKLRRRQRRLKKISSGYRRENTNKLKEIEDIKLLDFQENLISNATLRELNI